MKILCYVLMAVGMLLALGGVVAVFNFDQPSDMFSLVWWMIIGGWSLVLIGMGIDILQLFAVVTHDPVYTLYSEVQKTSRVEEEVTRM